MKSGQIAKKYKIFLIAALPAMASVGLAQDKPVGELRIAGTHIAQLTLQADDGHNEQWANVSVSLTLPVGTYQVRSLSLRSDYASQPQSLASLGPIEVREDEPAVLKAGGPLQQIIGVKRQGRTLVFNYGLQGIGEEQYAPRSGAGARFTVYRGDEAIATGEFEYG